MGTITIKNLIGGSINITTTGGGNTPPAGAERWVEPVYTDEWVFSNGQTGTTTSLSHTEDEGVVYVNVMNTSGMEGSSTSGESEIDYGIYGVEFSFITEDGGDEYCMGYRKYTPGHWEDADGNWINGSWRNWSYETEYTNTVIENDYHPDGTQGLKWFDSYVGGIGEKGWQTGNSIQYGIGSGPDNYDDFNANLLFVCDEDNSTPDMVFLATRTWNNTKPAPAA